MTSKARTAVSLAWPDYRTGKDDERRAPMKTVYIQGTKGNEHLRAEIGPATVVLVSYECSLAGGGAASPWHNREVARISRRDWLLVADLCRE